MFKILPIILLLLLLSSSTLSQTEESKCSELSVSGPSAVADPGEEQVFTAKLKPALDPTEYTITWSVENGEIISGQGTMRLTTTSPPRGEIVTATADISGLGECNQTQSDTSVICMCPEPMLVDEFDDLPDEELKMRLEEFLTKLKAAKNGSGYIINYGPAREVAARERFIRNAISIRDNDPDRLVLVNGGVEDEIRTRMWIVPHGADTSKVN